MQYRKLKNLFLRQSYLDAWEDYTRSLEREDFIRWDYCILTASNSAQAQSYQKEIDLRVQQGFLPKQTHYAVLPDPDGKRVGSGGATFQVLSYIAQKEQAKEKKNSRPYFEDLRILTIHSGGDSSRVPQYSAIGKLFSPMPRRLPDGRSSVLFDELIIGMSGVPGRIASGMLVLSGDAMLLFNPLQIDISFDGAVAISVKASCEVGKDHGVFLGGKDHLVKAFLHKQSVEELHRRGAVNEEGNIDLDTGAVLFGPALLRALYGLITTNGRPDKIKFDRFCSQEARISFYGDFLYPLAQDATIEEYLNEPAEGEKNEILLSCRREIWDAIRSFDLFLLSLSPAQFLHMGTTKEVWQLIAVDVQDYEFLDWRGQVNSFVRGGHFAAHNSYVQESARIGQGAYLENAWIGENAAVGEGTIVSHLSFKEKSLPDHAVFDALVLLSETKEALHIVRIYGLLDNPKAEYPKKSTFLGEMLQDFLIQNGLSPQDLWPEVAAKERCLWNARLYPVCKTKEEALEAALIVYRMAKKTASLSDVQTFKDAKRQSLQGSFNAANTDALRSMEKDLENRILASVFVRKLREGVPCEEALLVFGKRGISKESFALLLQDAEDAPFSDRIRIYYALSRYVKKVGVAFEGYSQESLESACFETIQDVVCKEAAKRLPDGENYRIRKDFVEVLLPLRVNWGGGWTDTPPQCMEMGGTVLNAAILLRGTYPVQVCARRLPDLHVEFESRDVGVHTILSDVEAIRDCHNPFDAFALHKAALIACGVIPKTGEESLEEILLRLGGGIYLSTQAYGVPKGSGLGTSSILAGGCVKAIFEFLGLPCTDNELYQNVLGMEQLMSTGGGWQDQVGGLTGGVKLITTKPGVYQELSVEKVFLKEAAKKELQERFALIYTGQRRLARNLLRDVVGGYIGSRPDSIHALGEMKSVAVQMKEALEAGDIDAFAALFNRHWLLSNQLDNGTTNTCIDQIFLSLEDLIDGKFICGAGGGGFIQVIMKKGVTSDQLKKRLHGVFQDSGVDVWECTLLL